MACQVLRVSMVSSSGLNLPSRTLASSKSLVSPTACLLLYLETTLSMLVVAPLATWLLSEP